MEVRDRPYTKQNEREWVVVGRDRVIYNRSNGKTAKRQSRKAEKREAEDRVNRKAAEELKIG